MKNLLRSIKLWLIQEAPPEYQACELCRRPQCDSKIAEFCNERIIGERYELQRREKLAERNK